MSRAIKLCQHCNRNAYGGFIWDEPKFKITLCPECSCQFWMDWLSFQTQDPAANIWDRMILWAMSEYTPEGAYQPQPTTEGGLSR